MAAVAEYDRFNRNILGCKVGYIAYLWFEEFGFNRNILGCKVFIMCTNNDMCVDLIETYWDVKRFKRDYVCYAVLEI